MVQSALPQTGVLRVVPPSVLEQSIAEEDKRYADSKRQSADVTESNLAAFIRQEFERMVQHRGDSQAGWSQRLIDAQRQFNGKYSPEKLAEIRQFGGSEVYARIIAMKCRGASSLLRDVYLSKDRSWGIDPPADPDVPPHVVERIKQLVSIEVATLERMGAQVGEDPVQPQGIDVGAIRDRVNQLMEAARQAERKAARKRAKRAEDKAEELLADGGFYEALAEFLVDLPLFPFACIKGPVVRIVPNVTWQGNEPIAEQTPRMFWQRVSPFDLWWTPGASDIANASVIERMRLTRAELNDLLDLPGYNHDAVRMVLDEYGRGGLADNWETTDAERAVNENRENPQHNRSGLISCLEYHGNVQGRTLIEHGFGPEEGVTDELRDYMVQAWLIGRHIIKVQMSPSPRKRHPYYITSFEKVPGTPVGNGLPDILSDIQDVCNASLRALVNNLSISSGPQVVVNDERLAEDEDGESMYPWKRWHVTSDPMSSNVQVPISFFQPNSNAQELLAVYARFNEIADELSAIPKYLSGGSAGSGAGRTAAGLAMLMGNASKILQTVAANIDRDIFTGILTGLLDMLMLTDSEGVLRGDESVRVLGVNVAIQRETERARQIEFLQVTANPIDSEIMGPQGRAAVLRSVSQTIGLDGEQVVPDEETLRAAVEQQAQMAAVQPPEGGEANNGAEKKGSYVNGDQGPRVNIAGGPN